MIFLSIRASDDVPITGAAAGLGLALTRMALARGDKVIATGRSDSQFDELLSDSSIDQTRLRALTLDVTAPFDDIRRQVDTAVNAWGRVDVLVNNAGICYLGATEEIGSVRINLAYSESYLRRVTCCGSQSRGNDAYDADELCRCHKCHERRPPTHA
jgi:NAD(P)-dependent dehydrogenase (short-subunit alcohol dehydrogenase family)